MEARTYRCIAVAPEPGGFGARITGPSLARPLDAETVAEIRHAFARHAVVYFPDQPMDIMALERFTLQFGDFGHDPYIAPVEGHDHVLEVRREPDEKAAVFGASWHSDWSFQARPPAATLLYGETVPPEGGDTLFADGRAAWEALSEAMRAMLAPLRAVHSARRAYGPSGAFAKETAERSMKILVSPGAEETFVHPLVRTHPVSGRKALFVNPVYTVGVEGMTAAESAAILRFLFEHMLGEAFVWRHRWAPNMLAMWDNRCTMHKAEGGYDGSLRVMRRTTLAGETPSP